MFCSEVCKANVFHWSCPFPVLNVILGNITRSKKLHVFSRNLIPSFRSCVREFFLGIFMIILWNLKILAKPSGEFATVVSWSENTV